MGAAGDAIAVAARPRRFASVNGLSPLAEALIYDPVAKPTGARRLRRKAARALFTLLHDRLGRPSAATLRLVLGDGTAREIGIDLRQSVYLDFAGRERFGGYEPAETMLLDTMLGRAQSFYDIGANWGYYTLLAASHPRFKGTVHAFDVSADMIAELRRLVTGLWLDNVTVAGHGLSDRSGDVAISAGRHAHLTRITDTPSRVTARVERLDDCGLPPPDLIKIDVEDHEPAVLRGAAATLAAHRPAILFESHSGSGGGEAGAMLLAAGYRLWLPEAVPGGHGGLILRPAPESGDGAAVNLLALWPDTESQWFGATSGTLAGSVSG